MLNLVPPQVKQKRRVRSLSYTVVTLYIIVLAGLILGLVGLETFSYLAKVNSSDKQAQLDALAKEKTANKELSEKAAFVDDRVTKSSSYVSGRDWNKVLEAIASATPANVTLTGLKVSESKDKAAAVTITGSTPDRRAIILYQNKLPTVPPLASATITTIGESVQTGGGTTYTFVINATLTTQK